MAGSLSIHKIVLAALLGAVLLLLALTPGDAAAAKCPKEDASPNDASSEQLGQAVLCLIGKERRKADVKQLDQVQTLTRVAEKHTDVMIEEDCLQHRCPGEKSLGDRIQNSGYPNPKERYKYSEVTGCSLTPEGMVDAWMAERVFRKRLLGKVYRDVGIGAAKGQPDVGACNDGGRRGVYTVIFGWRAG